MEFKANEGKSVTIRAMAPPGPATPSRPTSSRWGRAIWTWMERYVLPVYQPGDILSMSEKVIAMCQKRIVTEDEVKPGFWAKLLSRFVHQTAAGPGMGLPVKMQFAINVCGLPKVLWAAFRAAIDKLRGVKGTFYHILGQEVSGLDGFYGPRDPRVRPHGGAHPGKPRRGVR